MGTGEAGQSCTCHSLPATSPALGSTPTFPRWAVVSAHRPARPPHLVFMAHHGAGILTLTLAGPCVACALGTSLGGQQPGGGTIGAQGRWDAQAVGAGLMECVLSLPLAGPHSPAKWASWFDKRGAGPAAWGEGAELTGSNASGLARQDHAEAADRRPGRRTHGGDADVALRAADGLCPGLDGGGGRARSVQVGPGRAVYTWDAGRVRAVGVAPRAYPGSLPGMQGSVLTRHPQTQHFSGVFARQSTHIHTVL